MSLIPGSQNNSTNGGLITVTPQFVNGQQTLVANYTVALASLQDRMSAVGKISTQVTQLLQQEKRADDKVNMLTDRIQELVVAGALHGQLVPQGDAIEPNKPAVDKRHQVALMGGVLGGGLPFGLLLLIGLLDSRYRYSDDTSDAGVQRIDAAGHPAESSRIA